MFQPLPLPLVSLKTCFETLPRRAGLLSGKIARGCFRVPTEDAALPAPRADGLQTHLCTLHLKITAAPRAPWSPLLQHAATTRRTPWVETERTGAILVAVFKVAKKGSGVGNFPRCRWRILRNPLGSVESSPVGFLLKIGFLSMTKPAKKTAVTVLQRIWTIREGSCSIWNCSFGNGWVCVGCRGCPPPFILVPLKCVGDGHFVIAAVGIFSFLCVEWDGIVCDCSACRQVVIGSGRGGGGGLTRM